MEDAPRIGGGLRRDMSGVGGSVEAPTAPTPAHLAAVTTKVGPKHELHRPWTYWEEREQDNKQVRV
jgi:hypothetical protein